MTRWASQGTSGAKIDGSSSPLPKSRITSLDRDRRPTNEVETWRHAEVDVQAWPFRHVGFCLVILYYTILYYTILYYIILYYILLYYIISYYIYIYTSCTCVYCMYIMYNYVIKTMYIWSSVTTPQPWSWFSNRYCSSTIATLPAYGVVEGWWAGGVDRSTSVVCKKHTLNVCSVVRVY